ncbi:MAG TPA: tetratricopeptide repeat protein [Candidatus Izemoplasmatales bacterium]|nr:tetratricopeptide repeat protein [Candidatus Izemoplasmatales bacterium]
MNIYDEYAIACAHLQGLVPAETVIEICQSQNPDLPKEPVKLHSSVLAKAHVDMVDGWVVHHAIVKGGDLEEFKETSSQKPRYVPPKEELLKYLDEFYFEKPEAYLRLEAHLRKKRVRVPDEAARILRDCLFYDDKYDELVRVAEAWGLRIPTQKALQEFINLLIDLANHIRRWDNNGYTPVELHELMRDKDEPDAETLQALLAALFRNHGRTQFRAPEAVRPFRALVKRQKDAVFEESLMNTVDALGERLGGADLFTLPNVFNLVDLCPFAYRTLVAWLPFSAPEDREDLLRLIIGAYERVHPEELKKPGEDFYDRGDNLTYILSLDSLGYLLKAQGRMREAIVVYRKALALDLADRKRINEAILVCYFLEERYAAFDQGLSSLPEDSLYRPFLLLLLGVITGDTDDDLYEAAKEKSPLVLQTLFSGEDVTEEATEAERLFLNDFLPLVQQIPKIREGLLQWGKRKGDYPPLVS